MAKCKGVVPSFFGILQSALYCNKIVIASKLSISTQRYKGVSPILFCKFGYAPNFNKSDNTFKLFTIIERYTGVHPFSFCLSISDISEQFNI